jgi:hypothetical protein
MHLQHICILSSVSQTTVTKCVASNTPERDITADESLVLYNGR